jgi:hypothetical protein
MNESKLPVSEPNISPSSLEFWLFPHLFSMGEKSQPEYALEIELFQETKVIEPLWSV